MAQAGSRRHLAALLLPIATAVMAAGIFVADTVLPHDIAVGAAYIVVVLVASRFCTGRTLVLVGAGCVVLIMLSYVLSPPVTPTEEALLNVTLRSVGIGIATFLAWQNQSAQAAARERGTLLDLTHDTIFVRGMDDVITYWNRGAESLYGWTRDEAVGKVAHVLLQTVLPAPREEIDAELLRTGRWEGELIHAKRDRTRITVASRWALQRDEHGRPASILETNNDVTERRRAEKVLRESEAKLEEAQRIARIGWWERDFRTNHVALSEEVCRTFGVQPVDLPHWQGRWLEVIHPEDRARVAEASAAAVRGGPRYDVEYRVVRPDGTVRIVHSQGNVTWDDSGQPVRQFGVLQDITELRRAEEELRASEERFRTLVQFSFDVYWESDAQHRFTRQEFAPGLADAPTSGSEIGKTRWEVPYVEPDEERWRKHRETMDAHLSFRDFELARPTPDRGKRYVSVSGLPVFDKAGCFVGYRGVGRHITDRKRAEQALRDSEARFRTFVDHATDALFLHDDQSIVLDVNRQACESLGYSRDELIGKHPREFDVGLDEQSMAQVTTRITAGETVTFESLHQRKDGTVFTVEIRARRFQQGENRFRLSLVRDVTERKRAEQRVLAQHTVARILAEAATVEEATPRMLEAVCECLDYDLGTLWRIDRETGVLRCAEMWRKPSVQAAQFEAATRASTFTRGSGLPGQAWATALPACISDVTHDPTFVRGSIAAREGLHAAFAFPILLGGEVIGVIDVLSRDVREPDQTLLDMMAAIGSQIGQFIERQRAEEALRQVQAELTHMTRVMAMGELTASIAHEINQPLTGVVTIGNACLRHLGDDAPNVEAARQAIEHMISDAFRASEVVKRIRALVSKSPPREDPLNIKDVVLETASLVRTELQRNNILLRTDLAEALPLLVGDHIQLQQVLLNLIINAKEAMSSVAEGPRELEIRAEQTAPDEILVSVRDTGSGLDETKLDEMFEAFHSTKPTGMGMGLAISRSIVEAHGGRLWASPNQPRGAVFHFTLPVEQERT